MYGHLQGALETIGFLHGDNVVAMMRKLRRMLGRAAITTSSPGWSPPVISSRSRNPLGQPVSSPPRSISFST